MRDLGLAAAALLAGVLAAPTTASSVQAADDALVTRGAWVSRDGLTWEHLDGRVVVVAHPRTDGSSQS